MRKIDVLIESVFCTAKARGTVIVINRCWLLEAVHDFCGLLGKAVALVSRRIKGLVVTVAQDICYGDSCQHDGNVERNVGYVFGLSGFEQQWNVHLRPPPQGLERPGREKQPQENR